MKSYVNNGGQRHGYEQSEEKATQATTKMYKTWLGITQVYSFDFLISSVTRDRTQLRKPSHVSYINVGRNAIMKIDNQNDLDKLIADQVEESLHLDYKAADALAKTDGKKKE